MSSAYKVGGRHDKDGDAHTRRHQGDRSSSRVFAFPPVPSTMLLVARPAVPELCLGAVVLSRTLSSEESNALSSSTSTKHPPTPEGTPSSPRHKRVPSHKFHIATERVRAAESQTVSGRPITLSGRKAASAPTGRARRPVPAECPKCHTREFSTPYVREGLWVCHSERGQEGTGHLCGHIWQADDDPRFCRRDKCPNRVPMEIEVHLGGVVGYACFVCKSFYAGTTSYSLVGAKKRRVRHYANGGPH